MPPNQAPPRGLEYMVVLSVVVACVAVYLAFEDEWTEPSMTHDEAFAMLTDLMERANATFNLYKRGRVDETGAPIPKRRRVSTNYNWERARLCITEDYTSANPRFNDRQFERIFRVTRSIVDELINVLAAADPFFREHHDTFKRCRTIYPYAKDHRRWCPLA